MTRPTPDAPAVLASPLLIDTDIGGDPDDAITVTCAARLPEFAAVITADENGGARARFARHELDLLGRVDVEVTAGADLGNTRYWVVDGMTPDSVADQPADVLDTIGRVYATTTGPVRWLGCGPMTNLAHALSAVPELRERLVITQMGGALHEQVNGRAEHNVRLDPDAARYVLDHAEHLSFVLSDTTLDDRIALYPGHPLHQRLAAPGAPAWARLLAEHIDRWHTRFGHTTKMHDPLTLTVALGLGFVQMHPHPITIAADGRMRVDPAAGRPIPVSTGADYPAFMGWLAEQLLGNQVTEQAPADRPSIAAGRGDGAR